MTRRLIDGDGMAESSGELFPQSPRVIYRNAPLIEVACELRFPPILRIEAIPAEFQEQIRATFPLFEKAPSHPFPALSQMPQLPPEIVQAVQAQIGGSAYLFLTEDRRSTTTLTPSSLSLSTTNYRRWEEFRKELRVPFRALLAVYGPSFFVRVGLRYIDAINRESLGLIAQPWSRLLRREMLGELAVPHLEKNIEAVARSVRLNISDGTGSVLLRHGLAAVPGKPGLSYVIDVDLFIDSRTEVADAEHRLDIFNELAGRAFRWVVTDELHRTLDPTEIQPPGSECD